MPNNGLLSAECPRRQCEESVGGNVSADPRQRGEADRRQCEERDQRTSRVDLRAL